MRSSRGITAAIIGVLLLGLAFTPPAAAHRQGLGADPDVVTEWNLIGVRTVAADNAAGRKAAIEVYLYLGFMQAAVFNAVVGIEGGYEPYRFDARPLRGASSQAAAVAAAYHVLVHYSPAEKAALDTDYAASLSEVPDGRAKARGIAYGKQAADRLIALRADDGRYAPILFTRDPAPGIWVETTPGVGFSAPWLGYVKPLLIRSRTQFDPGAPPALTSSRYARDFDEVKAKGSNDDSSRTTRQNTIATFYSGNPIVQFTTALADQADLRNLDIVESARMYAAVQMSMADASIAVWYTKHHYGLWRPVTAIRLADTDGNPATTADPDWTPELAAPPYPDYVSGYNGFMAAFTQALEETLGSPRLRLTLISTAFPVLDDPRRVRTYEFGREARADVIDARVWLGIHFRFADSTATEMGQDIARYVVDTQFQPAKVRRG